jgi:hypothetical protein
MRGRPVRGRPDNRVCAKSAARKSFAPVRTNNCEGKASGLWLPCGLHRPTWLMRSVYCTAVVPFAAARRLTVRCRDAHKTSVIPYPYSVFTCPHSVFTYPCSVGTHDWSLNRRPYSAVHGRLPQCEHLTADGCSGEPSAGGRTRRAHTQAHAHARTRTHVRTHTHAPRSLPCRTPVRRRRGRGGRNGTAPARPCARARACVYELLLRTQSCASWSLSTPGALSEPTSTAAARCACRERASLSRSGAAGGARRKERRQSSDLSA